MGFDTKVAHATKRDTRIESNTLEKLKVLKVIMQIKV